MICDALCGDSVTHCILASPPSCVFDKPTLVVLVFVGLRVGTVTLNSNSIQTYNVKYKAVIWVWISD